MLTRADLLGRVNITHSPNRHRGRRSRGALSQNTITRHKRSDVKCTGLGFPSCVPSTSLLSILNLDLDNDIKKATNA
jgi:hypothetical protein